MQRIIALTILLSFWGIAALAGDTTIVKQKNAGLSLPAGFLASVVLDSSNKARHLVVTRYGAIYIKLDKVIDGKGILRIKDTNGDGRADDIKAFGNYRGTGITIKNGYLYASSNDEVYRYKLDDQEEVIDPDKPERIIKGLVNGRQHNTKSIVLDNTGHIYVNIGSPSNSCQEIDRGKGSKGRNPCTLLDSAGGIWQFKADQPDQSYAEGVRYATGIRNVMGLDWNEQVNELFVMQHGRDQLDMFPEYFTAQQNAVIPAEELFMIRKGANCGWPYCYFDVQQNKKVLAPEYGGDGKKADQCSGMTQPLVAFPAHMAPNALLFYTGNMFPAKYKNGAFIAFHGSWNRSPEKQEGYYVVFVPFKDGKPSGQWEIFANGFAGVETVMSPRQAVHRPCGLAQGPDGVLYVSDDVKGTIYKIVYQSGMSADVMGSNTATHIVSIKKDTIVLAKGSTFRFTVDTPEDQGLVLTQLTVDALPAQLQSKDGATQQYTVSGKTSGLIETGDRLIVTAADGSTKKTYYLQLASKALSGQLVIQQPAVTVNTTSTLTLLYTAGQRSPDATVKIVVPAGINVTMENTTVNVIGRGVVKLSGLSSQSIGRTGNKYPYKKVGEVSIQKNAGGTVLVFKHLDLRPANGADLVITISSVQYLKTGNYLFKANYTTAKPEVLTSAGETATLSVTNTIADFKRTMYNGSDTVSFTWSAIKNTPAIQLQHSVDEGKTWQPFNTMVDTKRSTVTVTGLQPGMLHRFRLAVAGGPHKGYSNNAQVVTGKLDIKQFGLSGNDNEDATDQINEAIRYLHQAGGGTLLFSKGVYSVRTVHLQSNVYLYVEKGATIQALKGTDAPEVTWFSDKKYRSGLSPTDVGPYADPENYMTKQDVGHHYFRNSMFFGERLDNVTITGNGYITGNGNLVTGDRVMNNPADNRGDKMFTFKLCTNIEIGGIYRPQDLWYDSVKDEPYYVEKDGTKNYDTDNMLHIDRSGHFALLATGTDNIHVHDTWFGKQFTGNMRDIYDFMACNNVSAVNIYSKVSSDDIIKPGSDCSLGFTRPAKHCMVRNIIGDTNCNLFQIGSETADDIQDIHVDNIYVLGANKAGFSISTNDGGYIKDIHLNCGHTGPIHARSKMFRTFAPFFISISNRGRIIGAEAGKYAFTENGTPHNELLIKNVNIGQVENIILNGIDVAEVYAGSSFNGKRWKAYDGSQRRATPIIAGYSLPDSLDFTLPNGQHTGYIRNVVFNDVHILVKGGNAAADTTKVPPELGVGQYNASNLGVQPSFGLWARHVKGLIVQHCSFSYEHPDGRYVVVLDDVTGAKIPDGLACRIIE